MPVYANADTLPILKIEKVAIEIWKYVFLYIFNRTGYRT